MPTIQNASFSFARLPQDSLLMFSKNVETNLTTDEQFGSISAQATAELVPANTAYEAALEAAVSGNVTQTAIKNAAKQTVLSVLRTMARLVDNLANNDESVILASGFELRNKAQNYLGPINPVTELVVLPLTVPGHVLCKWAKVPHANKYGFQITVESTNTVSNGQYSDGSKLLLTNLPSQQYVLIQICAIGTRNRVSGWNEPVRVFVY